MCSMQSVSHIGPSIGVSSGSFDKVIPVLAKVTDLELWKSLPQLNHASDINRAGEGVWFVKTRIFASDFAEVKNQAFVVSLKVAGAVDPIEPQGSI